MPKPKILSVKRKEIPAQPRGEPRRARVLQEADWSLLLKQVREREEELLREKKPQTLAEEQRERALKDILPPEVGPGVPLEFAKKKLQEAMERARSLRGRRGPARLG